MSPKKIFTILFFFIWAGADSNVYAYTINGNTNVGDEDNLIASFVSANSGDGTEASFFNTTLNTSYIDADIVKTNFSEDSSASDYVYKYWTQVDSSTNIYAFDLKENDGYYLLKLGNIKVVYDETIKNNNTKQTTVTGLDLLDTFLFKNNVSEDWAVISLTSLVAYLNNYLQQTLSHSTYYVTGFDLTKISHVTEVNTPVPESTTMFLFGTGIVGLAGIVRRKRN